jgi:hypothetical protein
MRESPLQPSVWSTYAWNGGQLMLVVTARFLAPFSPWRRVGDEGICLQEPSPEIMILCEY